MLVLNNQLHEYRPLRSLSTDLQHNFEVKFQDMKVAIASNFIQVSDHNLTRRQQSGQALNRVSYPPSKKRRLADTLAPAVFKGWPRHQLSDGGKPTSGEEGSDGDKARRLVWPGNIKFKDLSQESFRILKRMLR